MKRNRIRSRLIATAIAGILPGTAAAVRVDYVIDAGYEHDDNVTLSADAPISQDVQRMGLGFSIEQDSSIVQAAFTGRLDHRRYEDIYPNSTDRSFSGRLNWNIIPDRFSFTLEDNYDVQTINRLEPDAPDNRQQTNVLSLGPNVFFDFSQTWRGQAELRYVDSYAEVTEDFDSARLSAAFRMVREIDADSALSFSLQTQDVDFDNDDFARDHKRTDAYASFRRTSNNFAFVVDAGYSTIDFDDGGDSGNPLLRMELDWNIGARSRLGVHGYSEFSDTASRALDAIEIGGGVPGSIVTGDSTVTSSIYELRELGGEYAFQGVRASLLLSAAASRIDYVGDVAIDEEDRSIGAAFDYRLRPLVTLRMAATVADTEYDPPIARTDRTRLYTVGVSKEWSRHWRTSLDFSRYQRTSPEPTAEFDQNVVYFSISYNN